MNIKPLALIYLLCSSTAVMATKNHDLNEIQEQVSQYLYSLPEISRDDDTKVLVHTIDKRLRLSTCSSLTFNLASGSDLLGKTSVRVICSAPKSWSFYLTATISKFKNVFSLNGSFNRGHIIKERDIFSIRKDLAKLPFGYITDEMDVIGKQLKRHTRAGRVLTPSQLRNPLIIKRGEIIALQKRTSGFMVNMKGIAMMDGAIGDRIRVKNKSSKRIIEGTITKAGIVTINN